MATIKSFTSLEQSRKLAEILPLESADMYYPWYIEEDGDTIKSGHRITTPNIGNFTTHKVNKMILPCWSLAALLGVLPNANILLKGFDKIYDLTNSGGEIARADNPIDACYELILKLRKLKML